MEGTEEVLEVAAAASGFDIGSAKILAMALAVDRKSVV